MQHAYQRFFGFERAPFDLVPDPDFLFLGESHDSALANLVMGIEAGKGFVAITGPIGAGKTTILRALLRRVGRTERVCLLSQPETDTADLLCAVLDGFGAPADGAPLVELRRRIRELLVASAEPGILLVDEAHLLQEEALEQIRLLSNLEEEHRKLLQIVLSGQPELKTLLSTPRLRPLAQRIEMFYEIRPLTAEETGAYLDRRLAIANGNPGARFSAEAAEDVHACTGGIPRLINLLADRALLSAYVAGTHEITAALVAEAFDDLGEVTQAVMPGRPPRRPRIKVVRPAPALRHESATPPVAAAPPAVVAEPPGSLTELRERRRRHAGKPGQWVAGAAVLAAAAFGVFSLGGRERPDAPLAAETPRESLARSEPATAAVPSSAAVPATDPPPAAADAERFALHVASFRRLEKAEAAAAAIRASSSETVVVSPIEIESGRWYRVLVGSYDSRDAARSVLDRLRATGEYSFVRTVRLPSPSGAEDLP